MAESRIVLKLSHHTARRLGKANFNSVSNEEFQVISTTKWARRLYSASVLELDTMCCFFDCQETKLEAKKTKKAEVDLQFSGREAQSTS